MPICCPTDQAPRSCTWRGDNNGQGTSTDCSAQCFPGETNIKGIGSSWGGGFTNDGNTNKCGRGYKVFCCTNPDASQVTRGCNYAACRANCPSGTTSVFNKYDNCWFGSQQYCCPDDPVELVGCHWVGGTDGDCANAVCNATELEVDRATYGGPNGVGCDCEPSPSLCHPVNSAARPLANTGDRQGDDNLLLVAPSIRLLLRQPFAAPICANWAFARTTATLGTAFRSAVSGQHVSDVLTAAKADAPVVDRSDRHR